MKRSAFLRAAAALALAVAAAGCMTHTRLPAGPPAGRRGPPPGASARPDDTGVQVVLLSDGSTLLYNRPHSRERLVKRLISEEGGNRGSRAILLEAGPGVGEAQLREMRDYLVKHRIPRVVLVTRPVVSAAAANPGRQPPPRR